MTNDRVHELRFDALSQAASWFARVAGDGCVEVALPAEVTGELWLKIHVAGEGTFTAQAKVIDRDATGVARCLVFPRADFREALARYALLRRSGRQAPMGPQRLHPRFDTCLKARFRSFQHLVTEYVFNISAGGMFVRTAAPPPLGDLLTVDVAFPDGQVHEVAAEVVWRVPPEQATPERPAGVGVRFLQDGPFHAALEQLLSGYLARRPRVLLVDDDTFFLRVLADGLLGHGMEVATASDGRRACHQISELLYDLDLVVLDLHMPRLDGRELLQRIRRLGFEMDLRIALVSGAKRETLEELVGPGGADVAIPKSLGPLAILEQLVTLLRGRG